MICIQAQSVTLEILNRLNPRTTRLAVSCKELSVDNIIPLVALIFQGIITVLFLGSFWIGYKNLREFKKSYMTNTLKTIMDDYQKLTNENAFDGYPQELATWKHRLDDSDFSPTLFYYNTLNHISLIGQFYEHVGLLVRDELVDFDVLYELLPFPHKFWEDTTEFHALMQEMTYMDFWLLFQYLRQRYLEADNRREPPKRKAEVLQFIHEHNN